MYKEFYVVVCLSGNNQVNFPFRNKILFHSSYIRKSCNFF